MLPRLTLPGNPHLQFWSDFFDKNKFSALKSIMLIPLLMTALR